MKAFVKPLIWKVSFGKARSWNEEATKENTRYRFFNCEKTAWAFIDRLNKDQKDKIFCGIIKLIAWNDLEAVSNE